MDELAVVVPQPLKLNPNYALNPKPEVSQACKKRDPRTHCAGPLGAQGELRQFTLHAWNPPSLTLNPEAPSAP